MELYDVVLTDELMRAFQDLSKSRNRNKDDGESQEDWSISTLAGLKLDSNVVQATGLIRRHDGTVYDRARDPVTLHKVYQDGKWIGNDMPCYGTDVSALPVLKELNLVVDKFINPLSDDMKRELASAVGISIPEGVHGSDMSLHIFDISHSMGRDIHTKMIGEALRMIGAVEIVF